MSLITRLLPDNPTLTKEMRVRMRGARAYWILLGYLGFLSLALLLSYGIWLGSVDESGAGASDVSHVGNQIFIALMMTQIFLVLFITPAITSGAITIEKEQRTLEMLIMTRLPRRSIVIGKLLSAILFTGLLIFSSLPLISICFMLGSVDPAMALGSFVLLIAGSFVIGAMGLMWSSVAKSTSAAVLFTYVTLIVPVILGFVLMSAGAAAGVMGGAQGGLSIIYALYASLVDPAFFGFHAPTGTGFVVLCLLAGVLLSSIAVSRLETWPERKAPLLRGMTALLYGVMLLNLTIVWLEAWFHRGGGAVMAVALPPFSILTMTAVALMLLVPAFATGELLASETRRFPRYLAWGWTPKGLARGKLASGPPFLLALTVILLALFAVTLAVMNRNTVNAAALDWTTFGKIAVVILASVGGFALMCLCMSVVFRNRWVALMLAYLFLVLVWILPPMARSDVQRGEPAGLGVNAVYFDPSQAVYDLSVPTTGNTGSDRTMLLLYGTPIWQVTTYLWLLIGATSLGVSALVAQRRSRQSVPSPYEETTFTG